MSPRRRFDSIGPVPRSSRSGAVACLVVEGPARWEAKTESDAELVGRAREGDASAYGTLVHRHARAAFAVALSACGDMDDAEDAVQDACLRYWDRLSDCREPDRFRGWLLTAARNAARNRREGEALRRGEPLAEGVDIGLDSPLEDAERSRLRDRLLRALERIPERERSVVLLHDLEGWLHREIAEALEISELMSRRLLSDARAKLRILLEEP